MKLTVWLAGIGALASGASAQQYVIGVDSTADAAHLFDATTGALVQQNYLEWGALGSGGSTAKHALQVGSEIWVSDQIRDVIYRFGLDGGYISSIGNAGLDNIKGMEVVGNEVWVTNAGSNNGATGNSIVFLDSVSGAINGSVSTTGSLFDLINYDGNILASNITTQDLEWYDQSGNYLGNFHTSDGTSSIDFPQQLFERANGNILAAGFSPPSGVYEFDLFGNSLGIVAGSGAGARGVFELLGGSIMWSDGDGFYVGGNQVFAGGGQYLSLVTIPAPGAAGLLGIGGLMVTRRRR